ncbi:MAG: DUF484 family protein [Gammaproteobacteria bacterium]|nr:DUF484 family protein [Gammaproteobacteria bacterium]MDH4310609.1 DUF484 family protein [Gammaproteobacteria bacterium]MDH5271819.1 DUF484 family protein [Gammaproteobacteria bacterium]
MNKPIRGAEPPAQLAEDQIADFLVAHPDFFERHGAVLARIKLPHQRGSAAISLVERQVLVLRDKHAVLEKKLHELIEIGRANDAISDRLHRLTRRLLRARDAAGVVAALETSLREDFGALRWVLLATDPSVAALGNLPNGHVRVVPRGSPELKIFETFFESGRPRSGQIRDTQRDYLFGGEGSQVGSTVLIPLGERAALGLLAIASHDTERYLPTMSTDYLVRIGEIVTEAVSARLA